MLFTAGKIITALLGAASCLLVRPAIAFTNPIHRPDGSDPQISYSGGYYYLLSTSWENVQVLRATTIDGLKTATPKVVYGGPTPWDDFTDAGKLTNEWSIDGTVVRFTKWGKYLVYSCFHGVRYQSLCLQKLGDDNASLKGSISVISQPTESWERSGTPVNKGPAALYIQETGKTYIVYSANYRWTPDYCLATLEWDGETDPTSASALEKPSGCVFKGGVNGYYGTGHNSFFRSPGGSQTWNAYHATSNSNKACDDSCYTMIQVLGSNSDRSPNFGTPVALNYDSAEPR
ncbi:glycoside hydrolase family 43 protein [Daldinia sp. FL1419]|nr:glycoside hydrolase family 43 protein [Daldinia sp. FL1419]